MRTVIILYKVMAVRTSIVPSANALTVNSEGLKILDSFCPISLNDIIKIVSMMKPSQSPVDILPASLVMKFSTSISPCLVSIINLSLKLDLGPYV